jgi:hypothetical protein
MEQKQRGGDIPQQDGLKGWDVHAGRRHCDLALNSEVERDAARLPRADRPLEQLQHGFGTPIGKDPAAYNACGVVETVLTVFDRTISAGDGPRRVPSRQHTILQDDGQTLSEQPCLCSARTRD